MSDQYEEIRRRNGERWGTDRFLIADHLGRGAHVGVSDLLAELVQNAEDADARCLGIRILDEGLLVWNDGRPFDDRDVQAITGLLVSGKEEASAIGYFGIGFKAVLIATRTPCVLSGKHRFWLKEGLDPYPLDVPSDECEPPPVMPPLTDEMQSFEAHGAVFWLPWRDAETRERLGRGFQKMLDQVGEFLLFLNNLRILDLNGVRHEVDRRERSQYSQEVLLRRPDGSEVKYLRLCWTARPPRNVVEKALDILRLDDERRRRWEKNPPEGLFGIALRLDEKGRPEETEGRVFVYLLTHETSGFRFHLQARMALTGDRKRVKPDDPMSRWALQELEEKARHLPEWLRKDGMFPTVWRVFPKEDEVEELWKDVAKALLNTLREGDFFYGDDDRPYRREQVLLAHRRELYEILTPEDLAEVTGRSDVRWVHPDLRDGRARDVVRSLGVEEVGRDRVLAWLETKTNPWWWETRKKSWLHALYRYLQSVQAVGGRGDDRQVQARMKQLPLVRLRGGTHVQPEDAVLPPKAPSMVPEALRSELERLPVVDDELASEFRELLHGWGVRDFHVEVLLECMLARFYERPPYPSAEENRRHIRLLFDLRGQISKDRFREWGQARSLLRDEIGRQVKPCEAYLHPDLGGLSEMGTYVRIAGGRPIVASDYRRESDSKDEWRDFLETLGCARLPRASLIREKLEDRDFRRRWCAEREIEYPSGGSTRGWVGLDWEIDGLEEILGRFAERPPFLEEAHALWIVASELFKTSPRDAPGAGEWHHYIRISRSAITWFYYNGYKNEGVASWVLRLRNIAWLPDELGNPRRPDELFEPALKEVLLPEGFYFLHPKIPLEGHREWARLLGIHMEANVEEVCRTLCDRLARGAEPEEVRPVYAWLERQCEDEEKLEKIWGHFENEPLILVPGRGRFRRKEVCWEDPTGTLPALKPHWSEFHRLFREFLEVPDRPTPEVVAGHLLRLLNERADVAAISGVAREITRRWAELSEEWQQALRQARWPGERGGSPVWQYPRELCIPDDPERARLLEGKMAWWLKELKDAEDLAGKLGVRRISDAEIRLHPEGDLGEIHEFNRGLRRLWDAVCWFAKGTRRDHGLRNGAPVVKRAWRLQVTYKWNGVESERVGKRAGLDVENWVLWTEKDTDEWDIGDALEEGLGIARLREFLKDVWEIDDEEKWKRILERWKTKLEAGEVPEFPGKIADGKTGTKGSGLQESRAVQVGVTPETIEAKAALAKEAMERAKRWLEGEGFSDIQDVSGHGYGYDIKACKGDEVRYVEVKGLSRRGPVTMTDNEWRTAEEKGNRYWLIVYVKDEDRLFEVRDPAHRLIPERQQYVLRDWISRAAPLA